ncbi:hypothetical protein GN958_ATG20640 [Phytophthora infestans]|uniref:Uncharacterized protein n=1 Tax=Phytophthora infestans TaxID=4787 RepID=A0A8S9TMR3_PHYIN|nr:hypothetical protein GN958_ATG20640 [Phytophthora infestans]
MVGELLRLRCSDEDANKRFVDAGTKTKLAPAWQHLASVMSQSLGMVISRPDSSVDDKAEEDGSPGLASLCSETFP